ncbi:MAG: hypothetical protein GY941_16405 [Planctomycetes bacterium]|nr:hypothetical protein [Planctomycetota bacterium]
MSKMSEINELTEQLSRFSAVYMKLMEPMAGQQPIDRYNLAPMITTITAISNRINATVMSMEEVTNEQ